MVCDLTTCYVCFIEFVSIQCLKLERVNLLSSFDFNFILRRYSSARTSPSAGKSAMARSVGVLSPSPIAPVVVVVPLTSVEPLGHSHGGEQ